MNNLFRPLPASLRFALHTTVAALLGLAVAAMLGLHHPWWASMTVWLVAQPTRGLLLERIVARLCGTLVGAVVGEAMLLWLGGAPLPTLVTLTAWVGICAAGGNLCRHFRTYAFVLSGYSAAIIVLFALATPGSHADVAFDRVLATVIGIACSAIVAVGIAPLRQPAALAARLDAIVEAVRALIVRQAPPDRATLVDLLARIAALHRDADMLAAGSARERRAARRIRRAAPPMLGLLASGGGVHSSVPADVVAERFWRKELSWALGEPAIRIRWRWFWAAVSPPRVLRAALRPMVAIAVASGVWLGTGWPFGAMMVVAAALFASLFSSNAQGNLALLHALAGSIAGALLGIVFRLAILPEATTVPATALCLLPVLLAGALLMRQPKTAKLAIDLNMTFLLTAQPLTPPGSAATTLATAAAIVVGVAIASITYLLVLPASPATSTRLLHLRAQRLAVRARGEPRPAAHRQLQRALAATALREVELAPREIPQAFGLLSASMLP
jgi:uncharacterized membrane protein YccC